MKFFRLMLLYLTFTIIYGIKSSPLSPIDLSLIGTIKFHDGLGRIPIGLINTLKNDLSINCPCADEFYDPAEIPDAVQQIIENPDKTPGNVGLFFCLRSECQRDFFIKAGYSLFESTRIPSPWVKIFNENFDMVIVPDEFYCKAYKESGVKIPVFSLPHGIEIDEMLARSPKKEPSTPFTFGCTSTFYPRKNQTLLLEAFHTEFGNDPRIRLKLHGRALNKDVFKKLQDYVKKQNITNVEISNKVLSDKEYNEFMDSLDCYVLVSKGEGFSVTPREALALAKPCILSDNTAHTTICRTGHTRSVRSEISEPAYYIKHKEVCGNQYNCTVDDVRAALRDVYINYQMYSTKAEEGRVWVQRYLWKNLRRRYLTLIKPQQVILGSEDRISDDCIITTSKALFDKYTQLIEWHTLPH